MTECIGPRGLWDPSRFRIFVEFKIKMLHSKFRCASGCLISGTQDVMTMWCHCILMLFLAYPLEPTGCGAATLFIQNILETENINAETLLFTSKL